MTAAATMSAVSTISTISTMPTMPTMPTVSVTLLAHSDPRFHAVLAATAALAVGAYGWAWLRGPSPWLRMLPWVGGVAAIVAASTPAMESAASRSFTGHMVQHLLVIVVAAPLLALAAPVRTFTHAVHVPSGRARRWRRRCGWWRRVAPVVAPVVFLGVLYATHLTSIYDRAIGERLIHELEHAAYLAAALTLWSAVVTSGRGSAVGRIGSVFAVIAGSALLAMILMASQQPLIPAYEASLGTDAALADQRAAAALMWVSGMAITLPLLVVAVWRWANAEERVARRAEALRGG